MNPTPLESEAAHLVAFKGFENNFLGRFPSGVAMHDLEYLAATTSAPKNPLRIRYPGKPRINHVIDAMAENFRRHRVDRDYRKPDGLGISGDAHTGELMEVTTINRRGQAATQLRDKLDTLNITVNEIGRLEAPHMPMPDWRPARWKPVGRELFYPLSPGVVLTFEPTYRYNAPPGVILYELLKPRRQTEPVPVPVPAARALQQEGDAFKRQTAGAWALEFGQRHPYVLVALRAVALVASAAAVIAAIIALLDPIPGDELACASAGTALYLFATTGTVPAYLR